jgi:hypothetical protein
MNADEIVRAARGLCEKATPGPWKSKETADYSEIYDNHSWGKALNPLAMVGSNLEDAAFIAASRTIVPQLCDSLEAAQKENEELKNILRFNMVQIHGERMTVLDALSSLTARAEKAEAENRWISVGERLPDVTEYRNGDRYKSMDSNELVPFLVCCEDTEIPFRAFYDGKNWGDGWGKQNVTHWQALPQPPQKG